MHAPIKVNPRLDRRAIAQVFKTQGRVHIPDVLAPASADILFAQLSTLTPWQLSLNVGQQHLDIAHQQLMLMAPEQRETMTKKECSRQSRRGFQHVFDNYPLYDLYQAGERAHPLLAMHEFLNSGEFLQFAHEITGLAGIAFADPAAPRGAPKKRPVLTDRPECRYRLFAYQNR